MSEHDIIIHFDGACEPVNPNGHMGMGIHIADSEGNIIHQHSYAIPQAIGNTNNVAEYLALKYALKYLIDNGYNDKKILCKGDSQLVIFQMIGKYKIKQGNYVPHALECRELSKHFDNIFFEHVYRQFNQIADDLSKEKIAELL